MGHNSAFKARTSGLGRALGNRFPPMSSIEYLLTQFQKGKRAPTVPWCSSGPGHSDQHAAWDDGSNGSLLQFSSPTNKLFSLFPKILVKCGGNELPS